MDAGREMDALIAEKVMGLKPGNIAPPDSGYGCEAWFGPDAKGILLPNYSTEIAAAWEVVEKMNAAFGEWLIHTRRNVSGEEFWSATYFELTEIKGDGISKDSAPHAICLAALKAKGVL